VAVSKWRRSRGLAEKFRRQNYFKDRCVLRVRSRVPLARADGGKLAAAGGENPNPLFFSRRRPPNSFPEASPPLTRRHLEFVYDIPTGAGETIALAPAL